MVLGLKQPEAPKPATQDSGDMIEQMMASGLQIATERPDDPMLDFLDL